MRNVPLAVTRCIGIGGFGTERNILVVHVLR